MNHEYQCLYISIYNVIEFPGRLFKTVAKRGCFLAKRRIRFEKFYLLMNFQILNRLFLAAFFCGAGITEASAMPPVDENKIISIQATVKTENVQAPISITPAPIDGLESKYSIQSYPVSNDEANYIDQNLTSKDLELDKDSKAQVAMSEKNNPPKNSKVFDPRMSFALFAIDTTSINTFWGSTSAASYNRNFSQLYNQYTIVPTVSISFFASRQDEMKIMGILSNYGANFQSPGCGTPNGATSHFYCFPTQNSLNLFRAWYSFKFNDNFKVIGGPKLYSYDLLPVSTAGYSPKGAYYIGLRSLLFDIVDFASVPGTYPLTLGPGGGVTFSKNGWALGGGVIAGNPQTGQITGMLDNNSGTTSVAQLSYTGTRGGFQAAFTNTDYYGPRQGINTLYFQQGSQAAFNPFNWSNSMNVKTVGVGGYYYITPNKFSISGGMNYGFYTSTSNAGGINLGDTAVNNSWLITLQHERVFRDDITIGTSFGQPGMLKSNTSVGAMDDQSTTPWMILAFLNWQVAKELSLSPFIYWSATGNNNQGAQATSSFGAALMATLALY